MCHIQPVTYGSEHVWLFIPMSNGSTHACRLGYDPHHGTRAAFPTDLFITTGVLPTDALTGEAWTAFRWAAVTDLDMLQTAKGPI